MINGEGVLEIPDGEDETEELPESDDQRDCEAGTLRGEDKHGGDADILGGHIGQEVEHHDGHTDVEMGDGHGGAGHHEGEMMTDVSIEEQESWQGQGV